MSAGSQPTPPSGPPGMGLGALLILLLFILLGGRRRRLVQTIRLASPAFVPLASDAAGRFAHDFGSAFAELIAAEERSEEA